MRVRVSVRGIGLGGIRGRFGVGSSTSTASILSNGFLSGCHLRAVWANYTLRERGMEAG